MKTVRDLLQEKGYGIWGVTPETLVFDALELMAQHNCGALIVLEGGALAGIFSERDYARKVILQGRASRRTMVRDIMTAEVHCVGSDSSIEECMALMTARRIRHLPVVDDEELVGVISIGDVVRIVISEKQEIIEQLESYITAR